MDPSVPSCWRREQPPRPPEAVPVNVGGCYWNPASSSEAATHPPPPHAHTVAAAAAAAAAAGTSNFF